MQVHQNKDKRQDARFILSRVGKDGGGLTRNIDRGGPVSCSDQSHFDYTGGGLRSLNWRWCQ